MDPASEYLFLGANEMIVRSKEELLEAASKIQKERGHPKSRRTHLLIQYKMYKHVSTDSYRLNHLKFFDLAGSERQVLSDLNKR